MPGWRQLLRSLLRFLGLRRAPTLTFQLDEIWLRSLEAIADKERRSPKDVAADLFYTALEQRRSADEYLAMWQNLTPREQEIAALTCLGYTNPQIAGALSISSETVKSHVIRLLRKFGVRNKVALRRMLNDWDFSAFATPAEDETTLTDD